MELNGITFNPKDIKGYSLADIGNGIVNLFRLNIEFPDDTEIIKVYKSIGKAKEVIDAIKAAQNEIVLVDGVTFDKLDKRFSTKNLTVEVAKIDALFLQDNMLYVLIGDGKFHFIESACVSLSKLAEYCPHLTKITNGVYINKNKTQGFFVTSERDVAQYFNILVSCNNVLLHASYSNNFDAAVKERDKLQKNFDIIN